MRKTAGCFIQKDEKFLLLRRSQTEPRWPGIWDLPAGRLEEGEDVKKGAIREAQEESGLKIEVLKNLGEFKYHDGEQDVIFYCFLAKPKTTEVKLSFEHDAFKWITKEEALKLVKIGHRVEFFLKKL